MLALLALIGVTFATFSGQARIGARNFAQSLTRPDPNELMSFALSQLIRDTSNPLSAIRGHSLLRDMYGNDAATNGSLPARPDGRPVGPFQDARFYVLAAGSEPDFRTPAVPDQHPRARPGVLWLQLHPLDHAVPSSRRFLRPAPWTRPVRS